MGLEERRPVSRPRAEGDRPTGRDLHSYSITMGAGERRTTRNESVLLGNARASTNAPRAQRKMYNHILPRARARPERNYGQKPHGPSRVRRVGAGGGRAAMEETKT